MKKFFYVVGLLFVILLLSTSGIMRMGVCVKGIGCLSSGPSGYQFTGAGSVLQSGSVGNPLPGGTTATTTSGGATTFSGGQGTTIIVDPAEVPSR